MSPVTAIKLAILIYLFALTGCALQPRQINKLADNLAISGAQETLRALDKTKSKERDRAFYLLNRGSLKRLTGELNGSNIDLQSAKDTMTALQATSVSENVGALAVNETLRSYFGTPSERMLVHQLMAYNYLQLGSLDDARVEILQADVTMRGLAKRDSLRGQLASGHLLSGTVYELNGELDNAMISYRRALEVMDERQQQIPLALQDSLLQVSFGQSFIEEYQRYSERFSRSAQPLAPGEKELLVFYADGNVSSKRQQISSVFSTELHQNVSLALPYYPPANYRPQFLTINVAGEYHRTQVMENIEGLARKDLEEQMLAITATTLVRATAKYHAVKKVGEEQGGVAGLMMLAATTISEQADLRSWNMLPSSLQVARIRIPEGVSFDQVDLPNGMSSADVLRFNRGNTLVLLASSLDQFLRDEKQPENNTEH